MRMDAVARSLRGAIALGLSAMVWSTDGGEGRAAQTVATHGVVRMDALDDRAPARVGALGDRAPVRVGATGDPAPARVAGEGGAQAGACPEGPAGTVLWSAVPLPGTLSNQIAVADDGLVVGASPAQQIDGSVFALRCDGDAAWVRRLDHLSSRESPLETVFAPPMIGPDGPVLIAATAGFESVTALVELTFDGAPHRTPWTRSTGAFRNVALTADDGRLVLANGVPRLEDRRLVLTAFDRAGTQRASLMLDGAAVPAGPVVLADGRVVVGLNAERRFVPAPTAPRPPPMPRTPAPPGAARAFMPHAGRPGGLGPGSIPVSLPARIAVVPPDLFAEDMFELEGEGVAAVVAAGEMVVVHTARPEARLTGFVLKRRGANRLWTHASGQLVVQSPVLGRTDEATGRLEVLYTRLDGLLVSLDVPGRADATGEPTFNWAVDLESTAVSPPVLGDAGVAYVARGDGVVAVRRADGTIAWSATPPDPGWISDGGIAMGPGGTVYASSRTGTLLAVATESGGLDPGAGWPTVRHDSRRTGRAHR